MFKHATILVLIFLMGSGILQGKGDNTPTRIYQTVRLHTASPQIDGNPGDRAWEEIPWEKGFVQREPWENRPPSQETGFKILYDDNNLYVLIRAFDQSPDSISRRLTRRDQMDGDMVGIQLDSYFDHLTAFSFIVSAAGVKSDFLVSSNGQQEDLTWDPIWYAATSIDQKGWVAEMRIPLDQLRFGNNEKQVWGMQLARFIHRKQELSLWEFIPQNAPGWVHLFGELRGLDGIKAKKQLEIAPYVVGRAERFEEEPGNPFQTGARNMMNAGVDGKIGVTNDLTLDFTINPDFGQVEADPSEVNLTAFETFFEEKRPFFIEGRNITSFSLTPGDGDLSAQNLFYSRRIGRRPQYTPELADGEYARVPENTAILGAFKLTGKTRSGWSLGLQESVTREEKALIDLEGVRRKEAVEPLTNYFLGRVQKDMNHGQTTLGGMITSVNRDLSGNPQLDFLLRSAITGGIDFSHSWNDRNYRLALKTYFSQVSGSTEALLRVQTSSARYYQRPDAPYVKLDSSRTSLTGYGGSLEFGKVGGNFTIGNFITWKSPGLEVNDLGFLPSADEIMQIFWSGYQISEPFSIFRSMRFGVNQWTVWDFGGRLNLVGGNIYLNNVFKNYWSLMVNFNTRGPVRYNSFLRGGPAMIIPGQSLVFGSLGTDSRKKWSAEFFTQQQFQYERSGTSHVYNLDLNYRPLDVLSITVSPAYSRRQVDLQYVESCEWDLTDRYLFGSINQTTLSLSLRLNYNITPNLTIQYWGQPFASSGKFSRFKKITNPLAENFTDRFQLLSPAQISYLEDDDYYQVDEDEDGTPDYGFENPDYKALEFRSNLVMRWEYKPGSTLFLVWSQNRDQYSCDGNFDMNQELSELYHIRPYNVFLIKFSYRFSL